MNRFRLIFLILALLLGAPVLGSDAKAPLPSPAEALMRLKMGNARYAMGKSIHPNQGPARRRETFEGGQHPYATLITCSDSRVPVEIFFDQGIGDIFVIRVAGNVCDTDEIGSIEYGVDHLSTPLMVVMGHRACGAVTAVVEGAELHGSIPPLVNNIRPAVRATRERYPGLTGKALVAKAVEANVWQSVADLLDGSPATRLRVQKDLLRIEGAVYDLESGEVRWLGTHPEQKKLLGRASAARENGAGEAADDAHGAAHPAPALPDAHKPAATDEAASHEESASHGDAGAAEAKGH